MHTQIITNCEILIKTLLLLAYMYIHTCAEGSEWKIGFNTNHYICSPMRWSRHGAGAKPAPQEMGPTPNFPHTLWNHAPQSYFFAHRHGRSTQGTPPSNLVCVNMPTVAEREYKNPLVFAPQPLCTCVNIPSGSFECRQISILEERRYYDCLFPHNGKWETDVKSDPYIGNHPHS